MDSCLGLRIDISLEDIWIGIKLQVCGISVPASSNTDL